MARSNGTRTAQRRGVDEGAEPITHRLFRRRPRTLLLLAGAFVAQSATAQQAPDVGASVTGGTILSGPESKTTPATKTVTRVKPSHAGRPQSVTATSSSTELAAPLPFASKPPTNWPVATSLKSTLRIWAQRQGWPAPQFLTQADWAVDVPGSIPGSIEDALKALIEGFGKSPSRPRIEISANHVMLVSEIGAE